MELFYGTELAFGNAYFTPRPSNLLKINTDLPVKTLLSAEVTPSAGSFAYSDRGLQNRFILWRADGSNLFIDEFSIDRDLVEPSLCINFSHSLIIPGTRFFIVRRKIFLLVIPTQSGIHRFYVPLERDQDDSLGDLSLISRLHQSGELYASHDFYAWKFPGIAVKVATGCDRNGLVVAAACMQDKQLLRILFPPLSPMAPADAAEETTLQGVGMLNRLFLKQTAALETWDMAIVVDQRGQPRVFNLSRDGRLRTFDGAQQSSATPLACIDLADLVPKWSLQIVDVALRTVQMADRDKAEMLLIHMVVSGSSHFVLLQQHADSRLSIFFSTTLDDVYIQDFACTVQHGTGGGQGPEDERFCLWAIVNESPDQCGAASGASAAATSTSPDDQDEASAPDSSAAGGQPYTLKRCEFVGSTAANALASVRCQWEPVRAATSSSMASMDSQLFKYSSESEAIRNRIFDGNNYAFDVVQRAVQVVCKQYLNQPGMPKPHVDYGNWLALSRLLEDFLASAVFKQYSTGASAHRGEEDDPSEPFLDDLLMTREGEAPAGRLKRSHEKFWSEFLSTCNQLQEERLNPLAVWHSSATGLVGVIQMCRFTVFCPPDEAMRKVCVPSNRVARKLFDLMRPNMLSNLRNPDNTLELINNNTDELCRLIIAFATNAAPPTLGYRLLKSCSQFLNSQFTVALVAMALRGQILARLKAAWIINGLVGVVPQILAISTEARVNPKLDMVISAYHCRISQLIVHFTTMWIVLSVRLISHDPVPKQINVAQAFLTNGTFFRRPSRNNEGPRQDEEQEEEDDAYGDEAELQEDEEEEDAEIVELLEEQEQEEEMNQAESFCTLPPPSRWDQSQLNFQREKRSQFSRFLAEQLDGLLTVLWPESQTLTLPRYLAENKFFDALKNYCSLNEPFPPELAQAFRFLQAVAHSGQNKPATAWAIFEQVANEGVTAGDAVLNELLASMYPSPSATLASGAKAAARQSSRGKQHSLVEYFNKVMFIFKEHKQAQYVVLAGERAIQFAGEGDGLLLSEVYTALFTQHLVARNYIDAVRSVLLNPNAKRQSVCLRQLVTHLLDTRQTQTLVALPYDQLADVVVDILEARSKADVVTAGAPMYGIAYAFHISRCEFAKAAKLMYDLSTRLRDEVQNRMLLQRRCNALATVYQTMQIAEQEEDMVIQCDWEQDIQEEAERAGDGPLDNGVERDFAMVEMEEDGGQGDALTSPNRRFKRQIRVGDVARELLKVEARLALIDADPMLVPPLGEEDILRESLRHKRYDMAWLLIKEFELKPYILLEQITEEAIRIDHESHGQHIMFGEDSGLEENNNSTFGEVEPDWVLCNRNFIRDFETGGSQRSHWRILISYLDLALKLFPQDPAILRSVAQTHLRFSVKLPPWLVQKYMQSTNFGDLLRLLLDYDDLSDAFKLLLAKIDQVRGRLKEFVANRIRLDPFGKIRAEELEPLLPYTHIECLLQMAQRAGSEERHNLPIAETVEKLREFNAYQRSMTRNPADA